MTDLERLEAFLKELTELSNKYNITIDGCGCCDSPYPVEVQGQGEYSQPYRTGFYEQIVFS